MMENHNYKEIIQTNNSQVQHQTEIQDQHRYQIQQQQHHQIEQQLNEFNEDNLRKRKIDEVNNNHHHDHNLLTAINQNNNFIILPQENMNQSNTNLNYNNHNNGESTLSHHNLIQQENNVILQQQQQQQPSDRTIVYNTNQNYHHHHTPENQHQHHNSILPSSSSSSSSSSILHIISKTQSHIKESSSSSSKKRRKRIVPVKSTNCYKTYDWVTHYNALIHYSYHHTHCNVPLKELYECDIPDVEGTYSGVSLHYAGHLGKWLARQRLFRKREGLSRLSADKEALLQKLVDEGKMQWELVTPVGRPQGGISWEMNYAALVQFGKEHGHCNVPLREEYRCEILPSMLASLSASSSSSLSSSSLHAVGKPNEEPIIYIGNLGKWLAHNRRNRKNLHGVPPRRNSSNNTNNNENNSSNKNDEINNSTNSTTSGGSDMSGSNTNNINTNNNNNNNTNTTTNTNTNTTDNKARNRVNTNTNTSNRLNGTPTTSKLLPYRELLLQRLVDEGKLLWSAEDLSSSARSKIQSDSTWPQNYAALLSYYREYNTCNVPHKGRYECDIEFLMEYDMSASAVVMSGGDCVSGTGVVEGAGGSEASATSGGVLVRMHYNGHLGNWLHNQRQSHKGNGFPLKPDREALLQQLVDEGKMRW